MINQVMSNIITVKELPVTVAIAKQIVEIESQERPIEYMIGFKFSNGHESPEYTLKYLDWEISTRDLIGYRIFEDEIIVERVKYKNVLHQC